MPHPYHTKKTPKCKYCDKPVKHNIINGRNKGYYKTCGSDECLKRRFSDKEVNDRKRFYNKKEVALCKHCSSEFIKGHYKQKHCKICSPTPAAQAIIRRYGISHPEYINMVAINKNCPICERELKYPVIDHDHKTGKIRGMICQHCNTALNVIENDNKLKNALNYLNKHKYATIQKRCTAQIF